MHHKHNRSCALAWLVTLVVATACASLGVTPSLPTPASHTAFPTATLPAGNPSTTLEAQVVAVYHRAAPSVVNVKNYKRSGGSEEATTEAGIGSGFIYDHVGHILTNFHVVDGADSVVVSLVDGVTHEADVVGVDPTNDLAILHVESDALPPLLAVGDSDELVVGQFVLAIGNPFGYEHTLTFGIISALGRIIESPGHGFIGRIIQTDASINPGNSGGPLLDLQGRVVGVNCALVSPETGSAGVGFAVSANTVQRVVPVVIRDGAYPHPWLGIDVVPLTPSLIRLLEENRIEVPVGKGLVVTNVSPLGPASVTGIRGFRALAELDGRPIGIGGDLIVAIDGQPVASLQELTVYIEENKRVGDTVNVTVLRDAEELVIPVRLAVRPTVNP